MPVNSRLTRRKFRGKWDRPCEPGYGGVVLRHQCSQLFSIEISDLTDLPADTVNGQNVIIGEVEYAFDFLSIENKNKPNL